MGTLLYTWRISFICVSKLKVYLAKSIKIQEIKVIYVVKSYIVHNKCITVMDTIIQ